MTARQKISRAQAHQLLQVYLHVGLKASRKLCVEYGVSRDYAAKRASEIGMSHKKIFCGYSPHRSHNVNHSDHRWKWAIERGAVVR